MLLFHAGARISFRLFRVSSNLLIFDLLFRRIVNFFLIVTQLGFCAVYFVFVASTIVEIAEWDGKVDKRLIIIILAVPVIFLSYIRSLEKLAYISIAANFLCVAGLITVYQYLARNLHDPTRLPIFAGFQNLPMFFAMALFSFEGIGVVSVSSIVVSSCCFFKF